MDYQISEHIQERFLGAEGRVAQWSVGGAMFGLTAAVVQMLIRSLVIKRNKVVERINSQLATFSLTCRKIGGLTEQTQEEELVREGLRRADRVIQVTGLP